jgi:hypothetical protein
MTTRYSQEFICDQCDASACDSWSWAHICINGSTAKQYISPDQNFDLCPACWSKIRADNKIHRGGPS